jgi:hypothetical protein
MSLYGPTEYEKSNKRNKLFEERRKVVDMSEVCEALANMAGGEEFLSVIRDGHWCDSGRMILGALRQWWSLEIERDLRIWADEQEEADKAKYDGGLV